MNAGAAGDVPAIEEIVIRHLQAADLPALEWDGEYVHFRRQFERVFKDYHTGLAVPGIAVRRTDGLMIGQVFVLLQSRFRTELADGAARAYLYSVRVKPDYRSCGIGSLLMATAENDLVTRGFTMATLNVARDNPGAYKFYLRLGYRVVAAEPGRWSYIDHLGKRRFGKRRYVHEPAWRMEKELRLS